jgi:hypothetical protein
MKEKTILVNLPRREKGLVASAMGIQTSTVDVHLARIRRKRALAKKLLEETDQYKGVLYPKRKGE